MSLLASEEESLDAQDIDSMESDALQNEQQNDSTKVRSAVDQASNVPELKTKLYNQIEHIQQQISQDALLANTSKNSPGFHPIVVQKNGRKAAIYSMPPPKGIAKNRSMRKSITDPDSRTTSSKRNIITVKNHQLNVTDLPKDITLYKLLNMWIRDDPNYSPLNDTDEEDGFPLELPPPLPHSPETLAKEPPRKKLSPHEIDSMLLHKGVVSVEQLRNAHWNDFRKKREWRQKQSLHRLHRYKDRFKFLIDILGATDELASQYLAKLN